MMGNSNKRIYLVLDNIRSAYNVGSIFRTSDGAGSTELFLCGITPTPENPKVLKTSLGADKSVMWSYFQNTELALKHLRENSIPIYAIETDEKSQDYREFDFPNISAIILGNEKSGISEEILKTVDSIIELPMRGRKNSLNVAVCTGVILYKMTEN